MARSSPCSRSRVSASSAANGSSMSRICGSAASTRAIWARCCMPPDSSYGRGVGELGQAHQVEVALGGLPSPRSADPLHAWAELDVAAHAEPRVEAGVLEDDAAPVRRALHHLAADRHRPLGRLEEPGDEPEQGGLAAPGRPEQAHELPAADVEVGAIEREDLTGRPLVAVDDAAERDLAGDRAGCPSDPRWRSCSSRSPSPLYSTDAAKVATTASVYALSGLTCRSSPGPC